MPNYKKYHVIIWENLNAADVYENESEFSGTVNTLINQGYKKDKDFEIDSVTASCIEEAIKHFERFYKTVSEC